MTGYHYCYCCYREQKNPPAVVPSNVFIMPELRAPAVTVAPPVAV